jgi:hypothetical protein
VVPALAALAITTVLTYAWVVAARRNR